MDDKIYTKTFTSFGGADVMVEFNNQMVGEIQSIDFKHDYMKQCVTGKIVATLFDKMPFDPYQEYTITIRFANEYGQRMMQRLYNVVFLNMSTCYNIDMIYSSLQFEFVASDFQFVDWVPPMINFEYMIGFIKKHRDSQDPKVIKTRNEYIEEIKHAIIKGELDANALF